MSMVTPPMPPTPQDIAPVSTSASSTSNTDGGKDFASVLNNVSAKPSDSDTSPAKSSTKTSSNKSSSTKHATDHEDDATTSNSTESKTDTTKAGENDGPVTGQSSVSPDNGAAAAQVAALVQVTVQATALPSTPSTPTIPTFDATVTPAVGANTAVSETTTIGSIATASSLSSSSALPNTTSAALPATAQTQAASTKTVDLKIDDPNVALHGAALEDAVQTVTLATPAAASAGTSQTGAASTPVTANTPTTPQTADTTSPTTTTLNSVDTNALPAIAVSNSNDTSAQTATPAPTLSDPVLAQILQKVTQASGHTDKTSDIAGLSGTSDPGTQTAAQAIETTAKATIEAMSLSQAGQQPIAAPVTQHSDVTALQLSATPTPTTTPEPYKQVLDILKPLQRNGDGDYTVTLQLHPADLGHVQIAVSMNNGQINMQMSADNPNARQLLRDSMNDLRQSLSDGGLQTGSLDVSTGDRGNQTNSNTQSGQNSRTPAEYMIDDETFFARLGAVATQDAIKTDGPLDVRI